jgi:hypothetical protein
MSSEEPTPFLETSAPDLPARKSKAPLYIGLGLMLVIALVGAAFIGGRLLNQRAAAAGPENIVGPDGAVNSVGPSAGGGNGPSISSSGGPGGDMMSIQIQVTPAPELPQLPPEVTGIFASREDNRLFLSTGNMGISISSTDGSAPQMAQSTPSGPQVEVVVTQDTKIYRDVTQPPDPSQSSSSVLQQTVVPGSVEDLTSNTSVVVWGRRTGDRVIADVLLYSQPLMMIQSGP